MFTGIIEAIGTVQGLEARGEDAWRLQVESQLGPELSPGASLAVNGCCLTVTASKGRQLSFDLLAETAKRTNLGGLAPGELINLERPMAANGRFDGHIVQGHVDCPAAIKSLKSIGADHRLEIELPVEFAPYVDGDEPATAASRRTCQFGVRSGGEICRTPAWRSNLTTIPAPAGGLVSSGRDALSILECGVLSRVDAENGGAVPVREQTVGRRGLLLLSRVKTLPAVSTQALDFGVVSVTLALSRSTQSDRASTLPQSILC